MNKSGIHVCSGVSCEAQDQCHLPGRCINGSCTSPPVPDGTECSDGSELTIEDRCYSAICVGLDPCFGLECVPLSQCHLAGMYCEAEGRVCGFQAAVTARSLVPIEDESDPPKRTWIEPTVRLTVLLTVMPTIPIGTCDGGVCSNPIKPPGTECNDFDATTASDECQSG